MICHDLPWPSNELIEIDRYQPVSDLSNPLDKSRHRLVTGQDDHIGTQKLLLISTQQHILFAP